VATPNKLVRGVRPRTPRCKGADKDVCRPQNHPQTSLRVPPKGKNKFYPGWQPQIYLGLISNHNICILLKNTGGL